MSQIIILSQKRDAHLSYVTNYLNKDDVILLDPLALSKGDELSYWISHGEIKIVYKGRVLNKVVGVWYRKPQFLEKEELPVPESYKDYSNDALRYHYVWLEQQFSPAVWMSSYYSLLRSSNKVLQLNLAAKLGLRVPDTLVTSNSHAAKQFLKKYKTTIIKPISIYGFGVKQQDGTEANTFFYATKVQRGKKVDLQNLHLAPSIFQEGIVNIVGDIRVNVVGEKAFPAIITNPGLKKYHRIRDWRIGHQTGTLKIEPFKEFPKNIADRCVAFLKALGLTFGAFDFVLDKKGKFWFLENNGGGQWAFVEDETKQQIGKEIAHFLLYGKNT